ncbi:MAG: hypothetical protein ACUVT5_06775 [Candidatus Bathyarchaeales archaeon]
MPTITGKTIKRYVNPTEIRSASNAPNTIVFISAKSAPAKTATKKSKSQSNHSNGNRPPKNANITMEAFKTPQATIIVILLGFFHVTPLAATDHHLETKQT